VISPPRPRSAGPAEATALFAAARRRRRRRRAVAALLGLVLGGSLLGGLAAWPHQAAPRSVPNPGRGAVPAGQSAGFTLPGATVAWIDYYGGLHLGDVATQTQRILVTLPAAAGAGTGWLVTAGGRLYVGGSTLISEVDLATGTVRRVHRGTGVFASADGRQVYLVQADGSLVELPVAGPGRPRTLRAPAGWSFDPDQAVAGGILVGSQPAHAAPRLGIWSPGAGPVRVIATGAARSIGAVTAPGARYSMVAWAPAGCPFASDCPVEITNTATLATVSARSPLHQGFASTGVEFSPSGTELAAWARVVSLGSQCCANTSELAIIEASTGAVHLVPAARLVTQEDAGWILWLPGGQRLLAGALSYSYAVDTSTYAARPFFFFPQTADGPDADHDIMDTPDINFSAVLLPAISSARPGGAS
jgi:hypothetical protein